MSGEDNRHEALHERVWTLLPWYANNTLGADEHRLVTQHLGTCLVCRKEAHNLAGLRAAIEDSDSWADSPQRAFSTVLARIDASEAAQQPAFAWRDALRVRVDRFRLWLQRNPFSAQRLIAAQATLILALGAVTLWVGLADPRYKVLSDLREGDIRLVFTSDATESDIRSVILSVDGSLVGGPSAQGLYKIALRAPGDAAEVARTAERLTAHPAVELATSGQAANVKTE